MRNARHRLGDGQGQQGPSLGRRTATIGLSAVATLATVATGALIAVTVSATHKDDPKTSQVAAAVDSAPPTASTWTPSRMAAATPLATPTTAPDPSPIPIEATAPSPDPRSDAATGTVTSSAPATVADPPASVPPSKKTPPTSRTFSGTPTVGVLFFTDKSAADHYCTATVVHSTAGDLAITAAHCVYSDADDGYMDDIAFVPGYNGGSPYGQWTPSKIVVAPGWTSSADPDLDVGFLVLAKSSSGATIESVTGADQVAFNAGFGQPVTIPAYPQGSDTPITCTNTTSAFNATQTEFDCGGYPGGTSGGPFLINVDSTGNQGTVIGVIGGYQTGGDTPAISYSAYFGNDIAALYKTAVAAG